MAVLLRSNYKCGKEIDARDGACYDPSCKAGSGIALICGGAPGRGSALQGSGGGFETSGGNRRQICKEEISMKKILSLVLALTLTMSMATVGAGAKEFTDDGEISYAEAVAVISEIGVVDGYTDGEFRPTSQLTRGAAAKIICNLLLGPTTAAALSADTAPFKDVSADHTFAGPATATAPSVPPLP